ncbi:ribonuclease Z [Parachitinimonas caeni]|uniref:Ribonuclease Z n=1 Tax=Parachitinimonas caeni TaxID=3031301 RepID=A0ABT7E0J5_9NEIS|nr:ribonuclease Z [Parachitinimonas caeni]MDK2125840.1 ribonuclease Z [Parachitinimonas caeni]
MEITFLGTSSGTPTRTRNVSAAALRLVGSRDWQLIDCGEATQHRLLATPYSLRTLSAIFITHVHGDHCYGLPGLLASAQMAGRSEPLTIVGPAGIRQFVEAVAQHTELYLGYEIQWLLPEEAHLAQTGSGLKVQSVPLSHRVESFAYRFTEPEQAPQLLHEKLMAEGVPPGPLWAQIKAGKDVTLPDGRVLQASDFQAAARRPRSVIISGDNDDPSRLTTACDGTDVLVHEATYTQAVLEKVGAGPQHCSAERIARFASQVGLPNLVLTHFSPRYQDSADATTSIEEIRQEAAAHYHGRLSLACDYASYRLDRDGVLSVQA